MSSTRQKLLTIITLMISVVACNASDSKDSRSVAGKDTLSKTYFVKGMTCGGCILGVKTALAKAGSLNIVDKDISVGKAVLKFDKSKTDESEVNCRVTKAIEGATEFTVFLDKELSQPACKT